MNISREAISDKCSSVYNEAIKVDSLIIVHILEGLKPIIDSTKEEDLEPFMDIILNIEEDLEGIETNDSLKKLAYYDHLTKIYNRQMFDKLYIKELANKKRHGDSLSLIMLDIDYFKEINDTYGHDVGDKVLVALTKLISKNLRENDIFARWGGEEFLILLPRTDKKTAYEKAEKIRTLIESHQDKVPKYTVSFGITEILDYDKELSAFIRVDKALYEAKTKRNTVVEL